MLRVRVLGSGSDGNATLVEGGGARVLIDAGLGPRQLAERLRSAGVDPTALDAILLSHEHGDHARGASAFARRFGVTIAGTMGTLEAAGCFQAKLKAPQPILPGTEHVVRRLTIQAVAVPHDAARPLAFVIRAGESAFGHATDVGHLSRGLVAALSACDTVLVESNYDPAMLREGPYPWSLKQRILGPLGHLSNGDVARLIEKGLGERCRRVVLAHLSRKNNHPELALHAAEEALARAGRRKVELTVAGATGTGWIVVSAGRPTSGRDAAKGGSGRQMRLF